MIATVRQIAVRYVRPEPEQEERLRAAVCRLQAASILRAARSRVRQAAVATGKQEHDPEKAPAHGAEAGKREGRE